jgi:hypothetical protein
MKRLAPAALLLLLVTAAFGFMQNQQQGQHERADEAEQLLATQGASPTAKPTPEPLPRGTNPGVGTPGKLR